MPTVCLGEAIVDLVCERPVADPAEADAFRPHFGGAAGNVAYAAAALGAEVALAGGAGDDPWGRWLRDRLERVGVDLRWFALVAGLATPVALVTSDEGGEPTFAIYGDGIAATIEALSGRVEEAAEDVAFSLAGGRCFAISSARAGAQVFTRALTRGQASRATR